MRFAPEAQARGNQAAGKGEIAVPIIAKETGSNFKPAPAGVAMAVCCDVVDLGMLKSTYDNKETTKHKIKIVWQLAELDPEIGKRPTVQQRYTLSLHEKAALRRDLESWRGRPFTAEERGGFDVEKVIGIPCMLNIIHHESKGSMYANVAGIMPCPKGTPKVLVAPDYVREKDRPKDKDGAHVADDSDTDWMNGNGADDDSVVPF